MLTSGGMQALSLVLSSITVNLPTGEESATCLACTNMPLKSLSSIAKMPTVTNIENKLTISVGGGNIDVRICADEDSNNENAFIQSMEIYVQ